MALPREISRCPRERQLSPTAALAAPARDSTGQHSWPRAPRGLATNTSSSPTLLQTPVLCSSATAGAGRTPATWQGEAYLPTTLSFSTCRKETEETGSNPLRSLFWKGKSGSNNMWAGVSQAGFFSNDFSPTAAWGPARPSAWLTRCSGLQQIPLKKTYLSGTNNTKGL